MRDQDLQVIQTLVKYMVNEQLKKMLPVLKKSILAEMQKSGITKQVVAEQRSAPKNNHELVQSLQKKNPTLAAIFAETDPTEEDDFVRPVTPKNVNEAKIMNSMNRDYSDIMKKMNGTPKQTPKTQSIKSIMPPEPEYDETGFDWTKEI